jgi:hypothetical protein
LNATVGVITDHQGVVIIHAYPGWIFEFSKSSAYTAILFAQCLNQAEGLTRIKDLDRMGWVTASDMQVTMQVNTQSSCITTDLEAGEVLLPIRTPHRDSIVVVISHTQHGGRGREERVQIAEIRRPIQLLVTSSLRAQGGDEATRGIKELNSMVACVSHRDVSIGSTTYSLWTFELSLLIASFLVCPSNGIEWN